jgi:hypothetical protein
MDAVLAAVYDDFGRTWAHGTSPLYAEWAFGIGADPDLLALIASLPPGKRQPNLIFASARHEGAPLEPYPQWREWMLAHWPAVVRTALSHTTQTNEVGRCATLLPVLSRIDGPVALLEVGTAAGLCLYPDRYSYRYTTPAGIRSLDPSSGPSEVVLPCRIDADTAVPAGLPEIVWRRGIDLNPLDLTDAEAVTWLAELVWPGPDHDGRASRLRTAAEHVRADPPDIVRGDLLEELPDAAAESPADATLVVFHSAVLLYLDDDARQRFLALIDGLGARIGRRVVWLSNETLDTMREFQDRVPAGLETGQRFVQTVDGRPVALAGQHGAVYETGPFRDAPIWARMSR